MPLQKDSIFFRIYTSIENSIMKIVPVYKVGPVFKWIFKGTIPLFKFGMGSLVKDYVLLLTTTGRKTGKLRQTPLEHRYDKANDRYFIMAGWAGRTDWYRNIMADPHVRVQVGNRIFSCIATPASDNEIVDGLEEYIRANPRMLFILSRWADKELDGSRESLLRTAKYFPSFWLKPEDT